MAAWPTAWAEEGGSGVGLAWASMLRSYLTSDHLLRFFVSHVFTWSPRPPAPRQFGGMKCRV